MSRSEDAIRIALSQLGAPYVWGAWGQECTPEGRKKYAGYNPDHKTAIYKPCPVLCGTAKSCAGCKWDGWRMFDCRGFVWWVLHQAGVPIASGSATSQWENDANWQEKGVIGKMPDCFCCVYERSGNKMKHTGFHIGGGVIIHCSGTVKMGTLNSRAWTHYAIPKGLYEGGVMPMAVLTTGSSGAAVKTLQEQLKKLGYYNLNVDGKFGSKTAAAVKDFQRAYGLTVDGIVGAVTQEALAQAIASKDGAIKDPAPNVLYDMLTAARAQIVIAQQALVEAEEHILSLMGG